MFNCILSLDRISKINKFIKKEQTGKPDEFAKKVKLGRRQLYNILDDLKIMGAPIRYCRRKKTFYYLDDFDLQIRYSVKIIKDEKVRKIYGGRNNFIKMYLIIIIL